jgi:hypothetical protein
MEALVHALCAHSVSTRREAMRRAATEREATLQPAVTKTETRRNGIDDMHRGRK